MMVNMGDDRFRNYLEGLVSLGIVIREAEGRFRISRQFELDVARLMVYFAERGLRNPFTSAVMASLLDRAGALQDDELAEYTTIIVSMMSVIVDKSAPPEVQKAFQRILKNEGWEDREND